MEHDDESSMFGFSGGRSDILFFRQESSRWFDDFWEGFKIIGFEIFGGNIR